MFTFDRRQVGALLWLRGKLTVRQFTREKGRIVAAVFLMLFFAPFIIGGAVGTAVAYRNLEQPWPTELLGGVFVFLWLVWGLAPVLAGSANEAADITRLLVYPLPRRDLIVGVLLGALFDYPTYLVLPLFLAIFVGFGITPILPVLLIGVLLSYAHMVIIGQLVTTALGGILQSRRFRDLIIILASLLGVSCYFLQALFNRFAENLTEVISQEQLLAFRPLNTLQWFPTGAIARAVEQATAGEPGVLAWLGYSFLWLLLLTWAWWRLLVRLTTGEGFWLNLPAQSQKKEVPIKRVGIDGRLTWLPPDLAQLVNKEWKAIWRIPQRRVGMFQGILMPFLMVGAILVNSDSGFTVIPSWSSFSLPLYSLFLFWINGQNMLGMEGRGLSVLLLTPVPRQRIFLAKGIALGLVTAVPLCVIGAVLLLVSGGEWLSVTAVPVSLSMGVAALAVTSVTSVLFPVPINLESRRMRGSISTGGGCLAGLANAFLVPVLIAVVAFPAAAPLIAAYWWQRPIIAGLAAVLAPFYALVIFWFATRLAGDLLLEREAEVLAATRLPDDEP